MEPRISLITLGVEDMDRAVRFYEEGLGLPRLQTPPEVAFFEMGKTWLALYPRHLLAEDAGMSDQRSGFAGIALAHNVKSTDEVDQTLEEAKAAGATIVREARRADWGGYSGYFSDRDGHLWEVAWNPHFPHV